MVQDLAAEIREQTSLPSRRRELSRFESASELTGFGSLKRPNKTAWDQTRVIDAWAEEVFLTDSRLRESLASFVIITEERGVLFFPADFRPRPESDVPLLLLDPVDNTELVIRRLGGAVSALLGTARLEKGGRLESVRIRSAAVADVAGGEIFFCCGDTKGPQVLSNTGQEKLSIRPTPESLSISAISIKPERLQVVAPALAGLETWNGLPCRFFLHQGGPLPLCRVAGGDLDAAFELVRGYKSFDYAPGLWLAHRSGCPWRIFDTHGSAVEGFDPECLRIPEGSNWQDQMSDLLEQRTQFVVGRSEEIIRLILERFGKSG